MTKKSVTNLQNLSVVMCCARETTIFLKDKTECKFEVVKEDVEKAWDIVGLSMHTYRNFKVKLNIPKAILTCLVNLQSAVAMELSRKEDRENVDPAEMTEEEINEDVIMEGRMKIRRMYCKANDKSEVICRSLLEWYNHAYV